MKDTIEPNLQEKPKGRKSSERRNREVRQEGKEAGGKEE